MLPGAQAESRGPGLAGVVLPAPFLTARALCGAWLFQVQIGLMPQAHRSTQTLCCAGRSEHPHCCCRQAGAASEGDPIPSC